MRHTKIFLLLILVLAVTFEASAQSKKKVFKYMKSLGNGSYMFGQVGTWIHNENPDMEDGTNWIKKVQDHTGRLPRYGCITYDFDDNPFTDEEWNNAARKMWDKGMIVGIYSWYSNPAGGKWNDSLDIDPIFEAGDNPTKTNFYQQLDRMAANLQWLENEKIPVVYTPFVESDDRNKWHAKEGPEQVIKLYRQVHDYFENTKGLKNIIWAYHTTQRAGALPAYYPGDDYVDVIGKSAYGAGLVFTEYDWAVEKKKNNGKVIWWAELGIRGKDDAPGDCMRVLEKLESAFSELAGFVFWSDAGHYNVTGNANGAELMANPKVVSIE